MINNSAEFLIVRLHVQNSNFFVESSGVPMSGISTLEKVLRSVWLSFKNPKSPSSDGIHLTEVDIVIGDGEREAGHRDTHQVGGLVTGGNR